MTPTSSSLSTEQLLSGILLQLIVIVAAGRAAGSLALRLHQSRAVGEILVGILLGPTLFGALAPELFAAVFKSIPAQPMIILSQIGLILLMFEIGMEFDFSRLAHSSHLRTTLWVSLAGIAAPFTLGLVCGYYAAPQLVPGVSPLACALFVATAFSITALPILGRILIEFDLTQTPLGVIAISAAAINDVIGWLMLMVVSALAATSFSLPAFGLRLLLLGLYAVVCWRVVRPQLRRLVARDIARGPRISGNLLAIVLSLLFVSALCTYHIGIFAIFGGFMLGLLLYREREFTLRWSAQAGQFVQVLLLPVFFTFTGLRTQVGTLASTSDWLWCAGLIAAATLGKFGGCYLAARIAGRPAAECRILGILMNTRALMELIVLNIGLDMGFVSERLFTMLVLMALFSTIITTPLLKRWLPHLPDAARLPRTAPPATPQNTPA